MFKDDERGQTHYCEACKNENIQCPVCGYYCNGKGGKYCIDKPALTIKHTCGRQNVISHIGGEAGVSRKNKEALPFWEEELVLFIWGMDFSDPSAQSIAKKIMPFIRQVIKTEREKAVKEAVEDLENLPNSYCEHSICIEYRSDVRDIINKLKAKYDK